MTMILDGTNGVTFPSTTVQADAGTGYGQTWQNVAGSRAVATTYYNSTTKPISVAVSLGVGATSTLVATVNGLTMSGQSQAVVGYVVNVTFIVPVGNSYRVTTNAGSPTIDTWLELR
jgi:hypothetical protein